MENALIEQYGVIDPKDIHKLTESLTKGSGSRGSKCLDMTLRQAGSGSHGKKVTTHQNGQPLTFDVKFDRDSSYYQRKIISSGAGGGYGQQGNGGGGGLSQDLNNINVGYAPNDFELSSRS